MNPVSFLRDRISESEKELEALESKASTMRQLIEAYKLALAVEEDKLDQSVKPLGALRKDGAVNGLAHLTETEATAMTKAAQMARILEENRKHGISSTDIMETLKQRNVDVDSGYVFSYLSRNKAKGSLTYKDGKYCLVEGA